MDGLGWVEEAYGERAGALPVRNLWASSITLHSRIGPFWCLTQGAQGEGDPCRNATIPLQRWKNCLIFLILSQPRRSTAEGSYKYGVVGKRRSTSFFR